MKVALPMLVVLGVACTDPDGAAHHTDTNAAPQGDTPTVEADTTGSDAPTGASDVQPGSDDTTLVTLTEDREPCADRNPLRNAYFGDLHVHTAYSFDASRYDVRTTPAQAYAFARGESVWLPPLGPDGKGTREVRLRRPLDFAAVTDHAELMAETSLCAGDGPAADSAMCKSYTGVGGVPTLGIRLSKPAPSHPAGICGEDGALCAAEASTIWQELQDAAEDFYDRTAACTFTTFVGYEYSGSPYVSNIHRNVIFRNAAVPALPVHYFDEPEPRGLWAALRGACLEAATGCDVLAIPHNSNWSNGRMFAIEYGQAQTLAEQGAAAAERVAMEPLVEVFQHKGDSECSPGLASPLGPPDELCTFEKLRKPPFEDCGDGVGEGGMVNLGCVSRLDFVRTTLVEGLREEARIGANPYKLGLIGSTDTHNGTPGAVDEPGFPGHVGLEDDTPEKRLGVGGLLPGGIMNTPGGLAGVWAVEKSRDAIFEALRRREVFATSGPRITVRFFGGSYPADLCDDPDLVEKGYASGVPMGGDLPATDAPRFVVLAQRDPGTPDLPGVQLQRVQIVKGWVDADGAGHEQVWDVAGDPTNGASVDPATCAPVGAGADSLCAVWEDPTFDPAQRALWYVRVIENPSCRYNAWECLSLPEPERPAACTDPAVTKTTQERAWTSPIWYTPQ
ncbi:MAG: hypothetical protein AMXMBFR64_12850 [Myxococcales bacterium]